LISFDAAANENLTGTIPEAVGTQWTSLSAMSLFGTNLTGSIPQGFCQHPNVSQVYFGYDQTEITCDCCTVY
jgi:hypothetical protein